MSFLGVEVFDMKKQTQRYFTCFRKKNQKAFLFILTAITKNYQTVRKFTFKHQIQKPKTLSEI